MGSTNPLLVCTGVLAAPFGVAQHFLNASGFNSRTAHRHGRDHRELLKHPRRDSASENLGHARLAQGGCGRPGGRGQERFSSHCRRPGRSVRRLGRRPELELVLAVGFGHHDAGHGHTTAAFRLPPEDDAEADEPIDGCQSVIQ
jgi:hypothetical protein